MAKKKDETLTDRFNRNLAAYHAATGMSINSLGARAIANGRLGDKLAAGGSITLETADKVYDWMESQGYHFKR